MDFRPSYSIHSTPADILHDVAPVVKQQSPCSAQWGGFRGADWLHAWLVSTKRGSFEDPHSPALPRLFLCQPQICHFPSAASQSAQTYYCTEWSTTITSGFSQMPLMSGMKVLCLAVCVRLLMYKLILN